MKKSPVSLVLTGDFFYDGRNQVRVAESVNIDNIYKYVKILRHPHQYELFIFSKTWKLLSKIIGSTLFSIKSIRSNILGLNVPVMRSVPEITVTHKPSAVHF